MYENDFVKEPTEDAQKEVDPTMISLAAAVAGSIGGMYYYSGPVPVRASIGAATAMSVLLITSFLFTKDKRNDFKRELYPLEPSFSMDKLSPEKIVSGQTLKVENMGQFPRVHMKDGSVYDTSFEMLEELSAKANVRMETL